MLGRFAPGIRRASGPVPVTTADVSSEKYADATTSESSDDQTDKRRPRWIYRARFSASQCSLVFDDALHT